MAKLHRWSEFVVTVGEAPLLEPCWLTTRHLARPRPAPPKLRKIRMPSTPSNATASAQASADMDVEVGEESVATGVLMTNPPGGTTTIKKSAYALPAASLTFQDLTFALPTQRGGKGRVVLEPCSGHFEPGQLVAVMGPSGSGKTTLLDMLAAKKTAKYSGEVLVNGRPRDRLFPRIAAYVAQEDMLLAHCTVREAIQFNATLKRQPKRAHESVSGWIDVLLETFALGSVADSYIGSPQVRGISGGQRKRVLLARGVAAHASLLFCDEPTSGLSATDAELCVKALRTVAKRLGVLCLVVIHQPRHEVAELFDMLVLLTSNPGRMAYSGPMSEAQAYWQERGHMVPANVNPTDYFLDLLTPDTALDHCDALVAAFQACQKPALEECLQEARRRQGETVQQMLLLDGRPRYLGPQAVPFGSQLATLLRRKLLVTLRNPMALALPLFVPVMQGLVVGYMFEGIAEKDILRQVMFVFCLLTMLCLAGTMSLIVLITERTLMKHETSEALYCEGAFALATVLVDTPLALLGALGNVIAMASLAHFEWQIFQYVLCWSVLLFFVYDSLFTFIGAVATDTRQAQVLATPCVCVFMLFNGFVVSKVDSPRVLHWLFDISPNAYAMQAIVVRMATEYDANHPPLHRGALLLHQCGYSAQDADGSKALVVLFSMMLSLRVLAGLGLKFLNRVQR